ncbi:MAG: O-antigen ligase family protein [Alphaproteobacteria bacterium]
MGENFLTPARAAIWRGHIIAVMLTGALTIGMVAGGSLALAGISGGILLFGLAVAAQRNFLTADWAVIGFGGGLALLILLANLNAFAPDRAWPMSWRVISAAVPLALLLHTTRIPVRWPDWFRYLPWAVLTVELVLLAEFLTGGQVLMPWFHFKGDNLVYYDRGLSYAAVLIWPLGVHLMQQGRGRVAALVWLGLAVLVVYSASRGALLALAVGAGVAVLVWWLPRLAKLAVVGLLGVVAAGILLAVPWIFDQYPEALRHLPVSWQHRFEIWDYMMRWGWLDPLVGHGLDAAGVIPVITPPHAPYLYATGPAAHPHHAALQLWLELGPPGWSWAVALALWCLVRMQSWPRLLQGAGLAAWASYLTLAGGAFSLWTDSFLALAALTIFWLAASRAQVRDRGLTM